MTTAGTPREATRRHNVRIVRRVASDRIEDSFDDVKTPDMTATDQT